MSARVPLLLPLAVLLALAALPTARAGEDLPPYGASDLAMEEEALPKGWAVTYDEVTDTPGDALEAWATDAARAEGIDEGDLLYETRVLAGPEGVHATLLLVEVDADPKGLAGRLEKDGKAKGWTVHALGHPSRLLVLAAPEAHRQVLLDAQLSAAVATLTRLAFERHDTGSRVGAEAYANGALAIVPSAGMPHAVLGLSATKDQAWDTAIEEFRKAFDPKATHPPTGRLAHWSWRSFGYALLEKKTKEGDEEACAALEKAIATEEFAERSEQTFAIHYNLACALSRLGRTKPACEQLEKTFAMVKDRMGPVGLRQYVSGRVLRDPSLDNIRKADCFKALIDRVASEVGLSPLDGI